MIIRQFQNIIEYHGSSITRFQRYLAKYDLLDTALIRISAVDVESVYTPVPLNITATALQGSKRYLAKYDLLHSKLIKLWMLTVLGCRGLQHPPPNPNLHR